MNNQPNNWIQNLWKLRKEQSKSLNLKYDLKTLSENDLLEVKNFRMEKVMEEMRNTTYKGIDSFQGNRSRPVETPPMISQSHQPQPHSPSVVHHLQQLQQQHAQQQHHKQQQHQQQQLQQHNQLTQQMSHPQTVFPQQHPVLHRINSHPYQLGHMEPKPNVPQMPMGQMDLHQVYAQRMIPKLTKTTSANSYLLQNSMNQFKLQQQLQLLQEEHKAKLNQ